VTTSDLRKGTLQTPIRIGMQDMKANAWFADELLAYPREGGVIIRGVDFRSAPDRLGRIFELPASCIPLKALGRPGVGLFIPPKEVDESKPGRIIVLADPKEIIIVEPFIQKDWAWGKPHAATMVPVDIQTGADGKRLETINMRWFGRNTDATLAPIMRVSFGFYDRRMVKTADTSTSAIVTYVVD
jgi:hypothetical protein